MKNSSNVEISTSTVRSGVRSARLLGVGGFARSFMTAALGGTVVVWRYYLNVASNPTTDMAVGITVADAGANGSGGLGYKASDGKYYACGDDNTTVYFGATGVTLTAGWHLVDCRFNVAANPWLADVTVDGVALGQVSWAHSETTIGSVSVGSEEHSPVTADYFVDDLLVSVTSGDYPIGAGYVNHFVPTADGTHNVAGTNDFERTVTGTDINNATTTAYQLVDDVPLETGASVDWINMIAPVNATDYVECIFGPAPGVSAPTVGPRAVEVIAGIHQFDTATGNMEIRLNDNGTMNAMYTATTVAGVTTVAYKRKHYATAIAGGGAWVIGGGGNGDFTDLRVRFGSPGALDVVPDQYFDCIMIEAEFAAVVGGRLPPSRQITQAVNRASTY